MTAIVEIPQALLQYVKTGDANGEGLPPWPEVSPVEFDLLNCGLDDGPVLGPDPRPGVEQVGCARELHREQ